MTILHVRNRCQNIHSFCSNAPKPEPVIVRKIEGNKRLQLATPSP